MNIYAGTDVFERPLRFVLRPGITPDVKVTDMLIGGNIGMKRVIADCGYGANRTRVTLCD